MLTKKAMKRLSWIQTHNGNTFDPVKHIDSEKGVVRVSGDKLLYSFKGRTLEVNWFLADEQADQGREPANMGIKSKPACPIGLTP